MTNSLYMYCAHLPLYYYIYMHSYMYVCVLLEIPPSLRSTLSRLSAAFGLPSLQPPIPSLCWAWRDGFSPEFPRDMACVGAYKAWAAFTLQAGFVRLSPTQIQTHTHTHIYTYTYTYICIYVSIYVYIWTKSNVDTSKL